ncbi:MAG: AmmeMemoRadiSam system protein A [Chloroflexi bacterium]|nr:AmmeMemoRadiSam system protein A [Chloroflexota bacterium]
MDPAPLTLDERKALLQLARQTIASASAAQGLVPPLPADLPPRLRQPGVTFVTLTQNGELRGCVGALEAYQSLAEDVCEHAAAAAFEDFRFPPLRPEEVSRIHIEISVLTPPRALEYSSPDDLLNCLRPGIDGVLIRDGFHRATFLPQVWEKLPDPEEFMTHLCLKMGASANLWRQKHLQVFTYRVESFEEGSL